MKKENKKYLGIWLDHSKARLIEVNENGTQVETLLSGYSKQMREKGEGATGTRLGNYRSGNDEYSTHHRKMEMLSHYYKILRDRIKRYDETILFGPTTAKVELFDTLLKEKNSINVHVHKGDGARMTEKQMSDFVKDFYKKK
jgi:hypothetical protein